MGVSLFDRKSNEIVFDVNFWHYRAIVEAVRSLRVLPDETVDALHETWQNNGLTTEECRSVAAALRARLLPTICEDERLLMDGRRTNEPGDGVMHYDPAEQHKNYSTDRRTLETFANCCGTCNGFVVC